MELDNPFPVDRCCLTSLISLDWTPVCDLPSEILLHEPSAGGWRLLGPIPITPEADRSEREVQVVAHHSLIKVYGVGSTATEAIESLKSILVDLCGELEMSQAVLPPSGIG